ncbi:MAG: ABC transporter permease [Candidatus Adiutrix sp.]|jgi:phospholipid/cholesterol/gamma-HCH transport system permease protein|nr:ABC transporter permease [Candidatus Adiutrix sp.]
MNLNRRPSRPEAGDPAPGTVLTVEAHGPETRVIIAGPLNVSTEAGVWNPLTKALTGRTDGANLTFDLTGLTDLDLNGSAQLWTARAAGEQTGRAIRVEGLPERFAPIFRLAEAALAQPATAPPGRIPLLAELGRTVLELGRDLKSLTVFLGELTAEFLRLSTRPGRFNWRGVAAVAERSGVDAVPIVALVAFLVGLIIAFQAAMITKIFGAEIYVATLVGISVIRELGPLIAAIVLAGRSGSAFSAELGAMRVAEEIDALTTMGLSPVRELALPRVLAQVAATPVVTLIAGFVGVFGGSLVLLSLGYTMTTYWELALENVTMGTFLIGVFKSFVFGFCVGAIGCQRGLAAGVGPGAVGAATTSGVVTNIIVIAILDSLFAVVFYVVGL